MSTGDHIIYRGKLTRQLQYEAANRFAVTLYFIKRIHRQLHCLAYIMYHRSSFKNIIAGINFPVLILFFIEFITDITYHFFHYIFHGNDTTGTAKLIYHYGKVNMTRLKIEQEVGNKF